MDTSFSPGTGADSWIFTLAVQPDQKIMIGGAFYSYNGTLRNKIARLNSNGTIDISFNPGTGANSFIYPLVLLPNGKVLIGGNFTSYNGIPRNHLARLNSNGSLDTSFNSGLSLNDFIMSLAVQSDGKVLIGGEFTHYNGIPRSRVARLNINGSLDTSFNPGFGAGASGTATVYQIVIQQDGKFIIAGDFNSFNGVPRKHIARLNSNGTLDTTFNPLASANSSITTLFLQPDGKVVIGGNFTSFNGVPRNYIARLNTEGSLDTTFNPGTGTNWSTSKLSYQSDGKILVGGNFSSYNGTARNCLARIWGLNTTLGTTSAKVQSQTIRIYPNPVKDRITIETTEPFQYEWYSITGKRLHSANINEARTELETHDLVPGTYLLKIVTSKGVETRRIVKE
jgi:uncharacterized delta-60 repeat protein